MKGHYHLDKKDFWIEKEHIKAKEKLHKKEQVNYTNKTYGDYMHMSYSELKKLYDTNILEQEDYDLDRCRSSAAAMCALAR